MDFVRKTRNLVLIGPWQAQLDILRKLGRDVIDDFVPSDIIPVIEAIKNEISRARVWERQDRALSGDEKADRKSVV